MINHRYFSADDYGEIQARYFAELRASGNVDADPSGWLSTYSRAEDLAVFPVLKPRDIARYYVDEGVALGPEKESICTLLAAWEGRSISPDEFTLGPSGASVSLVTLAALKLAGVQKVLFETPAYFGTIEQAQELGMPFDLIPTYQCEEYRLPKVPHNGGRRMKVAVWITQPRASLGFDQSATHLRTLLHDLRTGFLVVDEATDQSFPAHLAPLQAEAKAGNLIRLRSFTKGMGLNGIRLAAAIHHANFRRTMLDCLESLGGSLDIHSLRMVGALGHDTGRLQAMLRAANAQVNELRTRAERIVRGSALRVNRLTNGYIGSVVADLTELGRTHAMRRHRLLAGCRAARTPVILGPSMYLARDDPYEAIRLNFFNQPEHIVRGLGNILRLWET